MVVFVPAAFPKKEFEPPLVLLKPAAFPMETALEPRALLDALLLLEASEGRIRLERWGPRTLDCDIVLWHGRRVAEPGLTVPHPELPRRPFWLSELASLDIAPGAGGW